MGDLERGVTQRRIDWSAAHAEEWERAIREGNRDRARALYEEFGGVLREEIAEQGGRPVLSDPATNERIRHRLTELRGHGRRALDLGCGPTPVAAMALRDHGYDVVAIDVAHSIGAIAKELGGDGIEIVVGDAEALPFAAATFDVVTCDDTIEHVFDQPAAAAELARVIKPGGRLLIVTPNAAGLHVVLARLTDLAHGRRRGREAYHITQSHVRELRSYELLRMFKPAFTVSYTETIGFPGAARRARVMDRIARLPGMWRVGWTLFVELERVADGQLAADHYGSLDDPDSQTSPDLVQSALEEWLRTTAIDGPILDVGTGIGTNLAMLSKHARAVGTDVSLPALRTALTRGPVLASDAQRLPFRDGAFGAAVCTEVLEHVDDQSAVLREIARVLRPGAPLYLTTPNYVNLAGVHKKLADWRSGRHDWNPWGAHEGGYEAFQTGRRVMGAARDHFDLERVRGLDYGQALTGRFAPLDKAAWSRSGRAVLKRLIPKLEGSSGILGWLGMHVELVLRKRA